jgi:single-stranded DNA-binding protein
VSVRTIKKGAHVLVEGSLFSSTYEQPNGKDKESATTKITSRSVRADAVRRLDRGEPEPEVSASCSDPSEYSEPPDAAPF